MKKENLKILIANNKTKQVIQILLKSNQSDEDQKNSIFQISSQYNALQRQVIDRTIDKEQSRLELANINQSLLAIIDQMPEETYFRPTIVDIEWPKKSILLGLLLLPILFWGYMKFFQPSKAPNQKVPNLVESLVAQPPTPIDTTNQTKTEVEPSNSVVTPPKVKNLHQPKKELKLIIDRVQLDQNKIQFSISNSSDTLKITSIYLVEKKEGMAADIIREERKNLGNFIIPPNKKEIDLIDTDFTYKVVPNKTPSFVFGFKKSNSDTSFDFAKTLENPEDKVSDYFLVVEYINDKTGNNSTLEGFLFYRILK